jgi:hypothetical protein
MKRKTMCFLISMLLLVACGKDAPEPAGLDHGLLAQHAGAGLSEWSAPVNLGPVVNSPFRDIAPKLAPDGLSLYFVSDRPGGVGAGNDIWVSRRASPESPWEAPLNLTMINSPLDDGGPALSADGRLLFFNSARSGGFGGLDMYVSRRADPNDDFAWEPPVNLGPLVNTAGGERGPQFVLHGENGEPTLYFNSGPLLAQGADLYAAPVSRGGEPLGPAVLVPNVNVAGANDAGQFVSHNGKEIWFWSGRAGGHGDADLWRASRKSTHDEWSTPVNVGAPPNTESAEERPFVTRDGRTLFFDSFRPGGINGSQDIWMSTLTRDGHDDDEEDDEDDDVARYSDWSAPVNLGPVVNSPANDIEVAISKDGLSLYIASTRPGGSGNFDLWVSQRATVDDPWGAPRNLGPTINTTGREQAPFLSADGHRLYFFSDRAGGFGGTDVYVSRRQDKRDDFGWESPENLGAGVNSASNENLVVAFEDVVYFNSNRPGGAGGTDIYVSSRLPDGSFGAAARVPELSSPVADAPCAIRRDGLEFFLGSQRPGTDPTYFDLWVATRASVADAWSDPINLGSVNTPVPYGDSRCALSFDATTLYVTSDRPGGVGGIDIWMSTRTKLKGSH